MAVAAVVVLPLHGMIHVSGRQRHISGEQFQGFEQGGVEMPAMHTSLRAPEVAPELGGTPYRSQLSLPSAPRLRPSVVAVELGERFGRRAEFDDLAAPRGLDGLDGGGVGCQRPEIRTAAAATCSRTMRMVSSMVSPCSARCLAASSITPLSTSTRTVIFNAVLLALRDCDFERWHCHTPNLVLSIRARTGSAPSIPA